MTIETPVHNLIQQLRRIGRRPPEPLVERILKHGAAARAPLLDLATDVQLLEEEEPVCWSPLHALRLLGELPDTIIIKPLIRKLPITTYDEENDASGLWATEVLLIIGHCGAPAYPLLWNWVNTREHNQSSRGAALHALSHVATLISSPIRECPSGNATINTALFH